MIEQTENNIKKEYFELKTEIRKLEIFYEESEQDCVK